MSNNKEILQSIKQIVEALGATINEAEKGDNLSFYKESIKHASLSLFEQAQFINTSVSVKPPVEIKIIQTEPVVEKVIPAQEIPKVEPVVIKEVLEVKAEPVINIPPTKKQVEIVEPKEVKNPEVKLPPQEVAPAIKSNPVTPSPIVNKQEEIDIDEATVNGKIAKFKEPVINLADKLKDTPIKELVKAISISKKFEFINELFQGNAEAYKSCIAAVESAGSFENAANYLENNVVDTYAWNDNEDLAAEFYLLVKRRYL